MFHRFDTVWTPTVLLLDSEGKERARLEGYLPNNDFVAALMSGLGRMALCLVGLSSTRLYSLGG